MTFDKHLILSGQCAFRRIAASMYSQDDREVIQHLVECLGGCYMDRVMKSNTHLLIPFAQGKYHYAKKNGMATATINWLVESAFAGEVLSLDNYQPEAVSGEVPTSSAWTLMPSQLPSTQVQLHQISATCCHHDPTIGISLR